MRTAILIILLYNNVALCQNLVPNSSFEEIDTAIHQFSDNDIDFIKQIKSWTSPNTASPDLITPEFYERFISTIPAHSGSMMVGIQSNKNWAEYISVPLTQQLSSGRTYLVEYWIRRAGCIAPSMNVDRSLNKNFGILFLIQSIKEPNDKPIQGTPQVKADTQKIITDKEWVKYSQYFTPKHNYKHLYLGQFIKKGEDPSEEKGYYFIDDISVIEVAEIESLDMDVELPIGTITPMNDIHFISGSAELSDKNAHTSLVDISNYLKSNPSIRIRINGHTDSKGNKRSNLSLSKRRAKYIASEIVQLGISQDRIEWEGFGEERPIAANENAEGRSKNRRVEFEIIQ